MRRSALEDRDQTWAEAQESSGDFFWTRRDNHDWSSAWPHHQAALDWWAGAHDIEVARARYLAMIHRMGKPPQEYYGLLGNANRPRCFGERGEDR